MLYENYKHSASAGNLWYDNQSAFLWRYGFKKWGKDSPRANMGKAAERAVYDALALKVESALAVSKAATDIFDRMHQGEIHAERESVGPIAANMFDVLKGLGGEFVRKPREARLVPGLSRRVTLEMDLVHSEWGIIDLKATLRMPWAAENPPAPHRPHIRQQGLYSHMEGGTPVSLLYATPKRAELYRIPEETAKAGARELLDGFEQIERWADKFPTPEQAIRFIPLNTDSFYWDDEADKEAALKLWAQHNRQAA